MSNKLLSGHELAQGESILSKNSEYELRFQTDGNLVVYKVEDDAPQWATNTIDSDITKCIMQIDGNLVLYKTDGTAVWASDTFGVTGAYLILLDDGQLEIRKVVWTNTTES